MNRIMSATRRGTAPRPWILVSLLLLLTMGSAQAQEISFTSTDPGLPVLLDGNYRLSSQTPFSLSTHNVPFTRIRVGGEGYELRHAMLEWDSQGRPRFISHNRRNALLGTLAPGMGSFCSGRRLHGLTEFSAFTYLAWGALSAVTTMDDAAEEHDSLYECYDSETDLEMKLQLQAEVRMAYRRWQELHDHKQLQTALTVTYAGLMIGESWWFNRPLLARGQGTRLVLQVSRLSRGKAIFASLIFPGMGQAYRGQRRSALYLAAETYLIQELLDTYTRREMHNSDYQFLKSYLRQDGLSAEENKELGRYWDKVQRATDDLKLFASLAGAVWLVNVMDSLVSRPELAALGRAGSSGRLSLATSPGGRPGLAWRHRF